MRTASVYLFVKYLVFFLHFILVILNLIGLADRGSVSWRGFESPSTKHRVFSKLTRILVKSPTSMSTTQKPSTVTQKTLGPCGNQGYCTEVRIFMCWLQ